MLEYRPALFKGQREIKKQMQIVLASAVETSR